MVVHVPSSKTYMNLLSRSNDKICVYFTLKTLVYHVYNILQSDKEYNIYIYIIIKAKLTYYLQRFLHKLHVLVDVKQLGWILQSFYSSWRIIFHVHVNKCTGQQSLLFFLFTWLLTRRFQKTNCQVTHFPPLLTLVAPSFRPRGYVVKVLLH